MAQRTRLNTHLQFHRQHRQVAAAAAAAAGALLAVASTGAAVFVSVATVIDPDTRLALMDSVQRADGRRVGVLRDFFVFIPFSRACLGKCRRAFL
jgi:N-acyl-D-aspartate/D-glutamate deacylase